MLNGGAGNDFLKGGAGADVFVFSGAVAGKDFVADFSIAQGDRIAIDHVVAGANIGSVAELLLTAHDNAQGDAVLTLGQNDTLTIHGVHASMLSSGWFLLT